MAEYTDRKGRTTAERIALVHRNATVSQAERDDARELLDAMLKAIEPLGATLEDFDWTIDLPGGCLDVVLAKRRNTGWTS